MIRWKGEYLSSLDFFESAKRYGSPFWDFHRADLHNCLLQRALELGADVRTNSRVDQVEHQSDPPKATVVLTDGRRFTADLVVGADGIVSRTRECFLGRDDPPTPTGDLAYRVLLDLNEVELEEDVKKMLETREVNYWMGPGCHAVCYLLRDGRYLNSKFRNIVRDHVSLYLCLIVATSGTSCSRRHPRWWCKDYRWKCD